MFIGLCVFVVIVEFFKSGDIRPRPVHAGPDLLRGGDRRGHCAAHLHGHEARRRIPSFHYQLGAVVLLVDAILSPFNSFRTALRNFQVGATRNTLTAGVACP